MPEGQPEPLCQTATDLVCIDNSPVASFVVTPSMQPLVQTSVPYDYLRAALDDLAAVAQNFAYVFINDAKVRENYVRRIRQMSEDILRDVREGRASAEEGADMARTLRDEIMNQARAKLSSVGKAVSEAEKLTGPTLEQLIEKTVGKLFPGRQFIELAAAERRQVFEAIIESSGRSSVRFTASIASWRLAGRGCVIFTVAIVAYDVWTAKNKVQAGLNDALVLGGGAFGGAIAGAATGLVCGPAAPFCSTALFVVGGIMGSLAGQAASIHYAEEIRELSRWLGDF